MILPIRWTKTTATPGYFLCGQTEHLRCQTNNWRGGKQQVSGYATVPIEDGQLTYSGITVPVNRSSSLYPNDGEPFATYYPSSGNGYEFQRLSPFFDTREEADEWRAEHQELFTERLSQWQDYYYGKYFIVCVQEQNNNVLKEKEINDCGFLYWSNRDVTARRTILLIHRVPPREAKLGFPFTIACSTHERPPVNSYYYNGCNWEYSRERDNVYDTSFALYGGFSSHSEAAALVNAIHASSEHIGQCYGYYGWENNTVSYIWEKEIYENVDYSYTNISEHACESDILNALKPYLFTGAADHA